MPSRFLEFVSIEELRGEIYRVKRLCEAFTISQKHNLLKLATNPTISCSNNENLQYVQCHEILRKGSLSAAADNDKNLAKIYFAVLALELLHKELRYCLLDNVLYDRELNEICLEHMFIDDEQVVYIFHILAVTAITRLDLSWNFIGNRGAKLLAQSQTLTSLNLRANHIRDEGIKALAANPRLAHLDVSCNRFGVEGAKALAANQTLIFLNVTGERVGAEGRQVLLETNPVARHNYGKSVGIQTNFPSLLSIAGFYAKKYRAVKLPSGETLQEAAEHLLPEEVKEQLDQRKVEGCHEIEVYVEPVKSGWCNML